MANGVREVRVKVTPNAPREYVEEAPFNTLRIGVTEPTEGGRANDRVRELAAIHFATRAKDVMIIKGTRERSKILRIYGSTRTN